jgi:hypothetical protein
MSIELYADRSSWLLLPSSFPTAAGELPREWENRVVDEMREAWRGGLRADVEPAVREALRHGLRSVQPNDSITLQYWPTASVANAVVHIVAGDYAPGQERWGVPLDEELGFVTAPVVTAFESPNLGTGVEARYLVQTDSEPPLTVGGVNHLFEAPDGFVLVTAEPTLPQLVGVMLEPLREVVRSIRATDDTTGAPWQPATADEVLPTPYGDAWNVDASTSATAG